jgi:hypothetical protein
MLKVQFTHPYYIILHCVTCHPNPFLKNAHQYADATLCHTLCFVLALRPERDPDVIEASEVRMRGMLNI